MTAYETARIRMVESQLRPNRVMDERVLGAFLEIRRELFVPEHLKAVAYVDEDLPLGKGRHLMEPMVAASSRAGRHTETERPRLAARSRASGNSAWCQVRSMGARDTYASAGMASAAGSGEMASAAGSGERASAAGDEAMRRSGVARPDRWLALYAPGFAGGPAAG